MMTETIDPRRFVINFFKVEEGIRCRVTHRPKEYEIDGEGKMRKKSNVFYLDGQTMKKYGYPLTDINDTNYRREVRPGSTNHFLYYIFDEGIRECAQRSEVVEHIIGLTAVMDVDSPHLNHGTSMRFDALGHYKDSILRKFELIHLIAQNKLEDYGLWDDTRMMWSGNGYYMILPDFFGDIDEIDEHKDAFVEFEKSVNADAGLGEGNDLCDTRYLAWNRYAKIPFTRHTHYPDRVSTPINKNEPVSNKLDVTDWRHLL